MRTRLPYVILALLLATAAAIFWGGSRLSRHVEVERLARDREPLDRFVASMQDELSRLDRLYESHLCRIARSTPTNGNIKIQMACGWLVGLRQVSVLRTQPGPESAALHVTINADDSGGGVNPRPAFLGMARTAGLPVPVVVLPDEVRQSEVHESGWLDQPGSHPLFWYRRSEELCIVLTVGRETVGDCMNRWMGAWVSQHFVPVEARDGGDRIMGPRQSRLAASGIGTQNLSRLPDYVLPMNDRFGSWQLLSWDGFQNRESRHVPTLVGSAALALGVALLGIGIFVQQRRAAKLAEQRVSFINRVSHELRAPLTNILLNVDLAADDLTEEEGESGRRLAMVQEEGRRLSRLIENVLTFSRQEQGRMDMHPGPCVPAEIIRDVVEPFSAALARRNIRVEMEGGVTDSCIFDPDAFAQILTNLVSNVEKYAAEGGYLGIRSQLAEGRLIVTVSDRGSGIPSGETEKIFRPFYRLRNEVKEGATGTGLGLSIARDLALRMGGELRWRPSDIGAVFELWIPIGHSAEATT